LSSLGDKVFDIATPEQANAIGGPLGRQAALALQHPHHVG
jgi:hypothetical protein